MTGARLRGFASENYIRKTSKDAESGAQLTGWDFLNHERKLLGIKRNWKSVTEGEICNNFTVLTAGRGKEWVQARCLCGRVGKYTAASIKGSVVKQCAPCAEEADAKLAWVAPDKWSNTKAFTERDKEIKRIQDERRAKKRRRNKDRYG